MLEITDNFTYTPAITTIAVITERESNCLGLKKETREYGHQFCPILPVTTPSVQPPNIMHHAPSRGAATTMAYMEIAGNYMLRLAKIRARAAVKAKVIME